jgi:hypothetical protein
MEIYVITPLTILNSSVRNYNFIHNGKSIHPEHAIVYIARDSSGTSMPDEIAGIGKTNGNYSLVCKKVLSLFLLLVIKCF